MKGSLVTSASGAFQHHFFRIITLILTGIRPVETETKVEDHAFSAGGGWVGVGTNSPLLFFFKSNNGGGGIGGWTIEDSQN